MTERARTGLMKFDDDWPGVFIRGKIALKYADSLGVILKEIDQRFELSDDQIAIKRNLMGLLDDLLACDTTVIHTESIQHAVLFTPVPDNIAAEPLRRFE